MILILAIKYKIKTVLKNFKMVFLRQLSQIHSIIVEFSVCEVTQIHN